MNESVRPTPYGIRRAEVWLEMHGSAAVSMPMAEALASYAASIEEAAAEADRLVLDLEHMTAERNALAAEIEGEREGRLELRREFGAADDETFPAFIRRVAEEREQWRDAHASAEAACEDMIASFRKAVEEALDGPCGETVEEGIAELGRRVRQAGKADTAGWRVTYQDTTTEDRTVERILDGVAEMICTALEMSGQGQAAKALRRKE